MIYIWLFALGLCIPGLWMLRTKEGRKVTRKVWTQPIGKKTQSPK
jgi:hypothetical protein